MQHKLNLFVRADGEGAPLPTGARFVYATKAPKQLNPTCGGATNPYTPLKKSFCGAFFKKRPFSFVPPPNINKS